MLVERTKFFHISWGNAVHRMQVQQKGFMLLLLLDGASHVI